MNSPVPNFTAPHLRTLPMFFILGMARSGTTLIKTLVDEHPNMTCLPESKFMLQLKKYFYGKPLQISDIPTILACLRLDRKIEWRWKLDYTLLEHNLKVCIESGGGFNEICKVVYLTFAPESPKTTITLIGDKNPGYSLEAEWLNQAFPQSKFIHLVRDYRDCIASHNRVFKRRPVQTWAAAWNTTNLYIEKLKEKIPEQFITLCYEDLVNNPSQEVQKICAFLGVNYTDKMMLYYEKTTAARKNDLARPVHNQNIGKYKKYLSEKEVALLDWLCCDVAARYGYTPHTPVVKKPFYGLKGFLGRLSFRYTNLMIRLYYASPLFLQKAMGKLNNFMFRRFGMRNHYNNAEFALRKKQK